jgi:hypothetical protein
MTYYTNTIILVDEEIPLNEKTDRDDDREQ